MAWTFNVISGDRVVAAIAGGDPSLVRRYADKQRSIRSLQRGGAFNDEQVSAYALRAW